MSVHNHQEHISMLRRLICEKSIIYAEQQRIVSPTGIDQKWILDLRPVLLDGSALSCFAEIFWDCFADDMPFQICGVETTSIPLMSAIAVEGARRHRKVNTFIIRKERKTSGLARDIEGRVSDDRVIIVDDITNSSSSLEKARVIAESYGVYVSHAFVVVDFFSQRSLQWREHHRVDVRSIFTISDLGLSLAPSWKWLPMHRFFPLWSNAAPRPNHHAVAPRSTPICDQRNVFVGSDGGELRALDLLTGKLVWSFQVGGVGRKGIWSCPALHARQIFFGAYNGTVYALDADTGREVWRYEGADWVGSSPVVSRRRGLLLIGLEHEAPGAKGSIVGLDLLTGKRVWEHHVSEYIHCTPTLSTDESRVFIGTNGGELLCLDSATGKCIWVYRASGEIKAAPAVAEEYNAVVAGSFDDCIHIVNATTGESSHVIRTAGKLYTTPLVFDGHIYAGSNDKSLYKVSLSNGEVVAKSFLGGKIFSSPALIKGLVFVGTTAGKLLGVDPVSLAVKDDMQLPDRVLNPPVLSPDGATLVVPVFGNRLFAFRMEKAGLDSGKGDGEQAAEPEAEDPGLTAEAVEGAYAEGPYFRIREPLGKVVFRPFDPLPSRRLVGAAALVLGRSPEHQSLTMRDFGERFLPALRAEQARIFLRGLHPVGFVTWAALSQDAEDRLLAEARLPRADEWSSGDRVWIVDVVAPFGGDREMLDKVRQETCRGTPVGILKVLDRERCEAVMFLPCQPHREPAGVLAGMPTLQ